MSYFQIYKITKQAARPKKKEHNLQQKAISPKTKRSLPCWFGLGTNQAKLCPELPLPQVDVDLPIVKNHFIPCGLDYPASSDSYFSKKCIAKVCSCLQDHIQGTKVQVPVNGYGRPAISTERAFKK